MAEIVDEIIEVQEDTTDDKRKWCVYCHTSPSGKRYIGITGVQPKRRFDHGNGYLKTNKDGKYAQPAMANAILKYPDFDNEWKHDILYDELTEAEAKKKEKQLIEEYQTTNPKFGYNISPGGDAMIGKDNPMYGKSLKDFLSKEEYEQWKRNISVGVSKFYAKHPEECKKRSDRTKLLWQDENFRQTFIQKISGENNPNYGGRLFSGETHPMWGRHHSEESKKKNRDAHIGKNTGIDNPTSKPVYSQKLDRIFWGATQVNDELGISVSHISSCCRRKRKHAGLHPVTGELLDWSYIYNQEQNDGTVINGAIALGYVTEDQVNEYVNNLNQKETK